MHDAPLARSPIPTSGPTTTVAGWVVQARRSDADLTLADCTPLAKVQVRAAAGGGAARALAIPHGRSARAAHGSLVVGSGPGEWLLLGPAGSGEALAARMRARLAAAADGELVTVSDLTHGGALLRLVGVRSAEVLAKVCAIDFSEAVTPDGAALRSTVARVVTDVVRDDRNSQPSYLLHCDTSTGAYLFDALLDAGAEFGIDVDGFPASAL